VVRRGRGVDIYENEYEPMNMAVRIYTQHIRHEREVREVRETKYVGSLDDIPCEGPTSCCASRIFLYLVF
jgi:hypothetical protein